MKTASRVRRRLGAVPTADAAVPLPNDGYPDPAALHTHAATSGSVLHVDGVPLLADTGTSTRDGYRRLPGRPVHRRRSLLNGAGLRVDDEVAGGGQHTVAVRWHLAPGAHVRLTAGGAVVSTAAGHFPVQISASAPLRISIDSAMVATGLQTSILAPVLACRVDSALPIRITTCWRRALGNAWSTP